MSTAHSPSIPPPPKKNTLLLQKENLKAGRFSLSGFMMSKYIWKKEDASMILSENSTIESEN